MKKIIILNLSLLLSLAACSGSVGQKMGLGRKSPDEFMVVSQPALSVPPDFSLPAPSDETPARTDYQKQAEDLILGKQSPGAQKKSAKNQSSAENMLLEKAGTEPQDAGIREQLNEDERQAEKAEQEENNDGFLSSITPSFSKDEPKEPVIDSNKEKARIEKNIDEGKPATEGEPVTKTPKEQGLLNQIF